MPLYARACKAVDATRRYFSVFLGSLGFADPYTGVGFGYVMNTMQQGTLGGAGAFTLLDAFYEAL